MQRMSFTARLLVRITLVGVIPLIVVGLYTRVATFEAIRNSEKDYLRSSLHARSVHLHDWMHRIEEDLHFVGKSNCVRGLCDGDHVDREGGGCPFLNAVLKSHPSYRFILAMDGQGGIISRVGERPRCWLQSMESEVQKREMEKEGLFVSPSYCREDGHIIIAVARSAFRRKGGKTATVLAALDLSQAVQGTEGAVKERRKGEKFFILDKAGRFLLPPENRQDLWGKQHVTAVDTLTMADGLVSEYLDQRGVSVLGAAERVSETDWLLVAEIEQDVAFRWASALSVKAGTALFASLGMVMVVAFLMSRRLSLPVRRLAEAAETISRGGGWQKLPPFKSREAAQVGRAFNDMIDSLREKQKELARTSSLAGLGEFSSRTVHEMRGPLSSIKLNLQGLHRRFPEGSSDGEMSSLALQEVERLEKFLRNMLSLGKPLRLNRDTRPFASLMGEVKRRTDEELQEREVDLSVAEGSGEVELFVDGDLMNQALVNLVHNAAEWSGRGGTVRVAAERHPAREGWVLVSVADSGPGIMKGEEEKIFQPFYTTRNGGTGLGLAHVKKIAEYHGGRVTASNNGGAVLSLELPGRA